MPHLLRFRLRQGRDDLESGMNRALGFALVCERIAEECHDAVAQLLIDVTLVAGDANRTLILITPNDSLQDLGIDPIAQLGKADYVAEQNGELATLSFECVLRRDNLLGKVFGGVETGRTCRRNRVIDSQSLNCLENLLARSEGQSKFSQLIIAELGQIGRCQLLALKRVGEALQSEFHQPLSDVSHRLVPPAIVPAQPSLTALLPLMVI